jgi:hypothetical protein
MSFLSLAAVSIAVLMAARKDLREEHIIPFALGGNDVLPKASCFECERITSYIEGYVCRVIYGPMRSYYGIQKRKRKHSQTVAMVFETDEEEVRQVTVNEVPPFMLLQEFHLPSIFERKPPRESLASMKFGSGFRMNFERLGTG